MKPALLSFVLSGLLAGTAWGQNNAPNPSFEQFVSCPQVMGAPQNPPGASSTVGSWFKAGLGSTDFYNACSGGPNDVPLNAKGYQQARTGEGYAGLYAILDQSIASREYLQCQLNSPLQAGHRYKVSFWVSLADSNQNGLKASDELGAYFSNAFIVVNTSQISNVTPQVRQAAGSFLSDTANWTEVQDTLIAGGGEDHMIIGVFSPFAAQTYQVIDGPPNFYQVYYFIDDICVLDLDGVPLTTVKDTAICDGTGNVVLTARPGMDTYEWNTGATTQQNTVAASGTYWVRSSGNCELRTDTFHISLFTDSTNIDLGEDTAICHNAGLVLDAYNPGFTSYTWNTGATTPQIGVTASGLYIVTAQSDCGSFSDSIAITVRAEVPPLLPVDTNLCITSGNLVIYPGMPGVQWYEDTTGTPQSQSPYIDLSRTGTYAYWVTRTIDGCESKKSSVRVAVYDMPYPFLNDTTLCNKEGVWLGKPLDGTVYLWDNGSDSCCTYVTTSGIYHLRMSNICGQVGDSVKVALLEDCNNCLWLPSAFSPNGDGTNDVFGVKTNCTFTQFRFSIYNRYGQRIFTTPNEGETWEGTFNGAPCDVGTYYYFVEGRPNTTTYPIITKKGSLTLIR